MRAWSAWAKDLPKQRRLGRGTGDGSRNVVSRFDSLENQRQPPIYAYHHRQTLAAGIKAKQPRVTGKARGGSQGS